MLVSPNSFSLEIRCFDMFDGSGEHILLRAERYDGKKYCLAKYFLLWQFVSVTSLLNGFI